MNITTPKMLKKTKRQMLRDEYDSIKAVEAAEAERAAEQDRKESLRKGRGTIMLDIGIGAGKDGIFQDSYGVNRVRF